MLSRTIINITLSAALTGSLLTAQIEGLQKCRHQEAAKCCAETPSRQSHQDNDEDSSPLQKSPDRGKNHICFSYGSIALNFPTIVGGELDYIIDPDDEFAEILPQPPFKTIDHPPRT